LRTVCRDDCHCLRMRRTDVWARIGSRRFNRQSR
jgi:hypothetical protein